MSVLASGPSFSGTHPRFISEMYLQKKITMTKDKGKNHHDKRWRKDKAIKIVLLLKHLCFPSEWPTTCPTPLTGILPVFRYTALLSVAVASVVKGKPSVGEDIVSLYTSGPLSLDMAVARECTREHLPSDVGGDEGNSAQFSSLPFCFLHPKASAMRILFWLSRFPLKALKVGCLVSQHAQLREKWSLWASLSPLSILAALRTQNLWGSWLLANTHPQRTPWSFLPSVLD